MIFDGGLLFGGLMLFCILFRQPAYTDDVEAYIVYNLANGAMLTNAFSYSSQRVLSTHVDKYAFVYDNVNIPGTVVLVVSRDARSYLLGGGLNVMAARDGVVPGSIRISKGHELFLFTKFDNSTYISNDELATISYFGISGYLVYDLAPAHLVGCKSDGIGGYDVYRKSIAGDEEFMINVSFTSLPDIRVHDWQNFMFFDGDDLLIIDDNLVYTDVIDGLIDVCYDASGEIYSVRQDGGDVICAKYNGYSFDDVYTVEGTWGEGNKLRAQDGLIYLIFEDRIEIVDAVTGNMRVVFDAPEFDPFLNARILNI